MIKKLLEGLLFGAGFGISFLVLFYLSAFYVVPNITSTDRQPHYSRSSNRHATLVPEQAIPDFSKLSLPGKIEAASVIVLIRFVPGADGKPQAVVREFLKKEPNVAFYYNVGDKYPPANYYAERGSNVPDGFIVFLAGSPAKIMLGVSVADNRINALGGIPLKVFRQKCAGSNA